MYDVNIAIFLSYIESARRSIQENKSGSNQASPDAAQARYGSGKTGRILVDYNGAKAPWAAKARIITPEGTIRGADLVWDTNPSLDVQQGAPESNPEFASSVDRYS